MSDCSAFIEFCQQKGNEVACAFLEELCDMEWNRDASTERITISSTHRHNACNHTHSGIAIIDGVKYGFIIDNGDWNGTVVREWGPADDVGLYEPSQPTIFTFIPTNRTLKEDSPGLWGVYLAWRKEAWFKDKERGYNYDRHFAPGGKTEGYYRDWAAKKGLMIASRDEADEIINRPIRDLVPMGVLMDAWNSIPSDDDAPAGTG